MELVITERDPEKVSQQISKMLTSAQLRQILSKQARAWVEKHHNIDEILNQYVALLRDVVTDGKMS